MTEHPEDSARSFADKKAEALEHFYSMRETSEATRPSGEPLSAPFVPVASGAVIGQWIFGFSCLFACFIINQNLYVQAGLMAVAGLFLFKAVKAMIQAEMEARTE